MARLQRAEMRLLVWEGSFVHDVLPLTKDLAFRRSRKIGRNSTIAFVADQKGGPHVRSYTFGPKGEVRHLVSRDPCADLFRFSEKHTVRKGRKDVIETVEVDIYVSKDLDKAWIITKP